MIKRAAWALLAVLALGAVGFYAVGGRAGVMLLVVQYILHKDYAPPREVVWQAGPPTPALAATSAPGSPARRPPNVVLIVADDLGFNDITHYGGGIAGGKVPTPHIDSIARDGVNFRNGYSGQCHLRALTGCHDDWPLPDALRF